jgi:hypothetical protein
VSPPTLAPSDGGICVWGYESPVEQHIREGNAIVAELRLDMSPSKVNRLARQYQKHAAAGGVMSFRDYMIGSLERKAEKIRPDIIDEARIFLHPDPTGEHAVNRVKNERRRAERRAKRQ